MARAGLGTPPEPEPASPDTVLIPAIQGTPATQTTNGYGAGGNSPLVGTELRIEGVVTAVFADLGGFFVQEEAAQSDGDPLSLEGIFVYAPDAAALAEGQIVALTGTVGERFGMTQISAAQRGADIEITEADDNLGLIDVAVIDRSAHGGNEDAAALEQYEGMKVSSARRLARHRSDRFGRRGPADPRRSELLCARRPDRSDPAGGGRPRRHGG